MNDPMLVWVIAARGELQLLLFILFLIPFLDPRDFISVWFQVLCQLTTGGVKLGCRRITGLDNSSEGTQPGVTKFAQASFTTRHTV